MRQYQAFVFDLYGTLADIRTDENKEYLWEKFGEIYSSLGAHYETGQLRERYFALARRAQSLAQEKGEKEYGESFLADPDLTAIFMDLFREKGVSCGRRKAAVIANFFRALSREKLHLYDGVKETLQKLRDNGRGVYLLSNAQSDFTRPELKLLGIDGSFDGILISSEEGCRKPSPFFYRLLRERFGLDLPSCLMVGNDMESDIKGAAALGMDTLYLHTETSPSFSGKPAATYAVLSGGWREAEPILLRAAGY